MSIFLRPYYGESRLNAKQIIKDPILFLAFGFGSGLIKIMPGTMGTIAAIPFYLLLVQTNPWIYWLFTLISLIFGVHICEYATKKLHVHDFGGIVWDEIVGYLITMGFFSFSWNSLVTGFLFFRLFDIFKPWPINWLDKKISGGLGIMLDDVLAGIFAAIALKFWF